MKERFTPPDKNLKRIGGLAVVDSGISKNSVGRRQAWYDLRCKCGDVFRAIQQRITPASLGKVALRCGNCTLKEKQKKQKAYYRKVKKGKSATQLASQKTIYASRVVNGECPPITPEAVRRLAQHVDAPYYRRALQILAEHVDACVSAGSDFHWERGAIEAIGQAQQEHRTGVPADADRWTPQNRADGLQIVSYPVYQMPSPL